MAQCLSDSHLRPVLMTLKRPCHPIAARMDGKAIVLAVLVPACRRDDAVHTQVFHHLPVVIVRVGHSIDRELNAGILSGGLDALGKSRRKCIS